MPSRALGAGASLSLAYRDFIVSMRTANVTGSNCVRRNIAPLPSVALRDHTFAYWAKMTALPSATAVVLSVGPSGASSRVQSEWRLSGPDVVLATTFHTDDATARTTSRFHPALLGRWVFVVSTFRRASGAAPSARKLYVDGDLRAHDRPDTEVSLDGPVHVGSDSG